MRGEVLVSGDFTHSDYKPLMQTQWQKYDSIWESVKNIIVTGKGRQGKKWLKGLSVFECHWNCGGIINIIDIIGNL